MKKFKNNKHGTIYLLLHHAIEATIVREGETFVVYRAEDGKETIFVRDQDEFYENFTEIDD